MTETNLTQTNLTKLERIVSEEQHGTAERPGHHLVIYEIVNGGLRNGRVVRDGDSFTPDGGWISRLWQAPPEYTSYAVNALANQRYSFPQRFDHKSDKQAFDLTFELAFAVSNPLLLVNRLTDDPLKKLKEEVARVVGGAIVSRPWHEIEAAKEFDNGAALGLDAMQQYGAPLRAYAEALGFALANVAVRLDRTSEGRIVPQAEAKRERDTQLGEIELKFQTGEAKRGELLAQVRHDHDVNEAWRKHELNDVARAEQAEDIVLESVRTIAATIASKVETMDDAVRTATQFRALKAGLAGGRAGNDGTNALAPAMAAGAAGLLPAASTNPAVIAIGEALRLFSPIGSDFPERTRLLSAILHWLAESLLEERAIVDRLESYRDQVTALMTQIPDGPTDEQLRFVRRMLAAAQPEQARAGAR